MSEPLKVGNGEGDLYLRPEWRIQRNMIMRFRTAAAGAKYAVNGRTFDDIAMRMLDRSGWTHRTPNGPMLEIIVHGMPMVITINDELADDHVETIEVSYEL